MSKKEINEPWPRAIILVDMNAFFASIEQLDHPEWRGRPLAVTNGQQGSCIITSSYEARAFGIKTGMRLYEARQLCPQLIQAASRPQRYAELSQIIMQSLQAVTPQIEIFSVDEAFLDVTACQRLHGSPIASAKLAQHAVYQASGLHCSVGVSGDKTTAKYAAKLKKPNGLVAIHPSQSQARLATLPVTDLCGIAGGTENFLARYGVYTCGDMAKIPMSLLAKRFGNRGRRLWLMCQGQDPEPVSTKVEALKSMGHGKVLPPNTCDKILILKYFLHMAEKLAARLRTNQMHAQTFYVGFRNKNDWVAERYKLVSAGHDAVEIHSFAKELMNEYWSGQGVYQVQITALDPGPLNFQGDLFADSRQQSLQKVRQKILATQDQVNARFGVATLQPARLIDHTNTTGVISPSWRATGARQSIDGVKKDEDD